MVYNFEMQLKFYRVQCAECFSGPWKPRIMYWGVPSTLLTSVSFFQVLGNAKGAVAVVVSILIFKNPVSVTGMLGYTLTVIGVILYSQAKKRSKQKRNSLEEYLLHLRTPLCLLSSVLGNQLEAGYGLAAWIPSFAFQLQVIAATFETISPM